MRTLKVLGVLAVCAAAAALSACNSNKDKKCCEEQAAAAAAPMTYETTVNGSVTAKVVSIDTTNRLITLQSPSGVSERFRVGSQVQRLNEVRVGDNLTISYSATLQGELRAPTAEEAANPIMYASVTSRDGWSAEPAGSEGTAVKVVTVVDSIDLSNMLVTLRGPLGNRMVVRAKSAENIRKLHVGDTVIVMYTEGMALAITRSN